MRTYALAFLLLFASAAHGAQTYRWVDERGMTNYGEKPPSGRVAQPVNVQPAGTVELHVPSASREPAAAATAPLPSRATPAPRGMAFETYIRPQAGMTEGELLLRAGPPDQETIEDTRAVAKSLYYYPTSSDPFLTVVTIRGGRIANLERNRKTN
jgi:hypothetical protein